jgi:integrase
MLALRPMGIQNRPVVFACSHPAMAPRMAKNSKGQAPERSAGRVAARALTDAAIRALRDGESRVDGALPVGAGRLIVECRNIRGSLRRSWVFRYRTGAHSGRVQLGDYPAIALEEARTRARAHIENVKQGLDPKIAAFEQKQEIVRAEREKASLGSFRSLLDSYVAHLRSKGKPSTPDVEKTFDRYVLKPWPDLAPLPARAVSSEMIRDILARMIKLGIGRQTNIVRAYLHAAFVHGAHSDLDPRRAASMGATFRLTHNPVHLVPRIAEFETARDRVLTDDELRFLWMGLDRTGVALAATIRCLILLGGQRFRQLLRVTWADYDALKKTLRLSDPKGKRQRAVDHVLPVGASVARELAALQELREDGDFVFSSNGGSKPIHHTTVSGVIRDIARDGSKKMVYRPGDIRRTVETRLQALGVSRDVRAQLLSHGRSGGVQAKHYERHDFLKEKAAALALWERYLLETAGRTQTAARLASHPNEATVIEQVTA